MSDTVSDTVSVTHRGVSLDGRYEWQAYDDGSLDVRPAGSSDTWRPVSHLSTIDGAIVAAEAHAFGQHLAGTCHESEWSCSHCESEAPC